MKIVKLKKKLNDIVRSDKKNSHISDLIDKCDEEALISSLSNISAPLPNSIFKPPVATSSTNLITKSEYKGVK